MVRTNAAHAAVKRHARGMLAEAKAAGDALIEAQPLAQAEGWKWKEWVPAHCDFGHPQASRYMKVARLDPQGCEVATFEGGIEAFLRFKRGAEKPEPKGRPSFDADDAEHAKKLHALATRGATEGERVSRGIQDGPPDICRKNLRARDHI